MTENCQQNVSIACIVYKDGKVLIAHRNPTGQMGNRWEFPGGKCELGEDCPTAISREMFEEFGVKTTIEQKITTSHFIHNDKNITLCAYLVDFDSDGISAPYKLTEHTEYRWVNIDDIPKDNFVNSDLGIYEDVRTFLNNLR